MTTPGHQLQQRGRRVILINLLDARINADAAGIEFHPIEQSEFSIGSGTRSQQELGQLDGLMAVK